MEEKSDCAIRRLYCTFRQLLNQWVQKVRGLPKGDVLMAPCGWMRPDGGHTVIFVVARQDDDVYSVTIVNPCGEGSEYHAKEAYPAKGQVGYCLALESDENLSVCLFALG